MQKEQRDKEHTHRRAAKILRCALKTRINRIHASPPLWTWWSVFRTKINLRAYRYLQANLHPIAHLYLSLSSLLSIGFLYLLAKWNVVSGSSKNWYPQLRIVRSEISL